MCKVLITNYILKKVASQRGGVWGTTVVDGGVTQWRWVQWQQPTVIICCQKRNLIPCERHEWWGEMSLPWWVDVAGVDVAQGWWLDTVKGQPVMWQAIQAGAGKQRGEEILVLTMHVVMMPSVVTIWTMCHIVSTHHRCLSTSSFIHRCPCG